MKNKIKFKKSVDKQYYFKYNNSCVVKTRTPQFNIG